MGFVSILPYIVVGETSDADYGFTIGRLKFFSATRELDATPKDGRYILNDFNPSADPLDVELTFSFRRSHEFFSGDRAIGGREAILGIALFWESRTSARRGTGSPVVFMQDSKMNARCIAVHFESGTLLGDVILRPKVFLVKPSSETDPRFAQIPGSVFGAFGGGILVSVDRSAGSFPISEFRDPAPSAPLWTLHMDWSDPLLDPFTKDHFEIRINAAHRNYDAVRMVPNETQKPAIPVALKEILTTSLFALFTKLKASPDSWGGIVHGDGIPGSIGDLAWTYLNEGGWNTRSIPELLADIRREFDI